MTSWGARRQLLFLLLGILLLATILGLGFLVTKKSPSCFDDKQNQDELGIDCGGVCQSVCIEETNPLATLWVRPFRVSYGRYGAIALIENNNLFGVREIKYLFKLYDENNLLIKEKEGTTYSNPDEQFVVFETNINTGNRNANRAFIEIESQSPWERFSLQTAKPSFSVQNKKLSLAPAPRVSATLRNNSFFTIENIEVVAIIFDRNRNAISASQTVVDSLDSSESREIFFTWPEDFAGIPSYVEIFPRTNRFSITN